jgi:hypothetical protein
MKKALLVAVVLLGFYALSSAGSIILPYWQDDSMPTYSMFCILNTGTTNDLVWVRFYGSAGNPQGGGPIERTIAQKTLDVFGTGRYPGSLKTATGDLLGYAIASDTGGTLLALGLVYDNTAKSGYVIPCFQGQDDLSASSGW